VREQTRALGWLIGVGVVLALARISFRTHLFATDGAAAVTDLAGVLLTAGAMYGVLGIRALSFDLGRDQLLDEALASFALATWLIALLPPRPENFVASGPTDDFIYAYAPAAMLGAVLVRVVNDRAATASMGQAVARHFALLGVLAPLLGVAVWQFARGAGAQSIAVRSVVLAVACGVASVVARRALVRR
jgi:hypothetical protein